MFSYEILDNSLLHAFVYRDLGMLRDGNGWFFELHKNATDLALDKITAKSRL